MKKIGFIFLWCTVMTAFSQPVHVPLNHRIYEFLDRMQARGVISPMYGFFPYSRADVARALTQIQEKTAQADCRLTRAESEQFEQFKGEFSGELKKKIPVNEGWYERHFLELSGSNHSATLDLYFAESFRKTTGDQSGTISHTTGGGTLRGQITNRLGFYLFMYNTLRKGESIENEQFNPSMGIPVTLSGKNAYSDDASAYFLYEWPHFSAEFGRDEARWGPGREGNLMLRKQDSFFDMLRLEAKFSRFRFTALHGKLNHAGSAKFIAAHRIEIQIAPWLHMAGSESVIYGNRDIESMYLNPLMPYHVAEHHLGDLDNNTMGFDMTLFPAVQHKLYFELFLDDYTTSRNPLTYYGNKWAMLTGWRWMDCFGLSGWDARIEYARIEPYVYTHKDSINIYQDYGQPLGHWLGPDSDAWTCQIGWLPARILATEIFARRIRHGEGDLYSLPDAAISKRKTFLSGTAETIWETGLSADFQFFRDCYFKAQYFRSLESNLNHKSGRERSTHHFYLDLSVNY